MTIRTATEKDVPVLENLYKDFLSDMVKYDLEACNVDASERIETSIKNAECILLVSENEIGINGLLRIQKKKVHGNSQNEPTEYVKITDLYVMPSMRKKGVASELIKFAIQLVKMQGYGEVILKVDESNESAHRLYKALGFYDECKLDNARIMMKLLINEQ